MTTDALNILNQAADKLEQILAGASPGPWSRGGYGSFGWSVYSDHGDLGIETTDSDQGKADADYIPTMDPLVGQALVVLFRQFAWMGRFDADMLARVGNDEVIETARAVLIDRDKS